MTKTSPSEPSKAGDLIDVGWIAKLAEQTPEQALAREAEIVEFEKRQSDLKAGQFFAAAGVPERHRHTVVEGVGPWGDSWRKVQALLGNGSIIPIVGTRGSGKTQMAVEAIRQTCKKHYPCLYTKAMGVFLDIREGMKGKDKSEREALQFFIKPRLLVIDAMEVRGETEFENRVLDYLVDLRYDAGLDTILISNQTREEFGKSLGLSIVSRIHESGDIIECKWESFRKREQP